MEKIVQQMTIKKKTSTSEIVFQQLVVDVKPVLDCITAALKKAQEGLDAAVADCKEANDKYLQQLDKADAEFNWMKNIQKEYNAITSSAVGIAKEHEKLQKLESTSKGKETCNLRLEKRQHLTVILGNIHLRKTSSRKYYHDCLKSLRLMLSDHVSAENISVL